LREEESWEIRTREALNELDELIWEYRKRKAANTIKESLKVHTATLESGVDGPSEPVLEETERQESTENLPRLEIDESDWDSRISRAYERLQRYLDSEKNNPGQSEALEQDTSLSSIMEIKSKDDLEKSTERHLEQMQYKRFEQDYSNALKYFEDALEERGDKPSLIKKLERLNLRDAYEAIHGMLPEVKIESMEDIDRLSEKYPDVLELRRFEEHRKSAKVYFEVTDDRSSTEKELAEKYNRSTSTIGNYRRKQEPHLLGILRRREEDRVIREWANSTQNSEPVLRRIKESYRQNENPVDFTDLYSIERIKRFDMKPIQGELLGLDTESRISEMLVTKLTNLCERTFQDRFRVYLAEIDNDLGKLLRRRRGAIELDLKKRLNHGTYKPEKKRIVLTMGELKALTLDSDSEKSARAKKLERIIQDNPSRLMQDEANMAEKKLRIEIVFNQERIRYSLRTGRVSVSWNALTATIQDTEKLAILCPPNDVRKKHRVRLWLLKRGSKLDDSAHELRMLGIPFEEWWR